MEIVREVEAWNETVRLDGRHFIDCTFTDCVLEYGGSEVILERTAFIHCRHVFFDHALMTLQFLRLTGVAPWSTITSISESSDAIC